MNVFRIFFASIFIPLISVGLCATGGKVRVHRNVFISEEGTVRTLHDANAKINSTVHFPPLSGVGGSPSGTSLDDPRKVSLLLPYHPAPLKLEILKLIKNSTRIDDSPTFLDHGEARGELDLGSISWLFGIFWKALSSYIFVGLVNILFGTLWKNFGWHGPAWEFKTTLGKKDHSSSDNGGGGGGGGGAQGGGQGHGGGWPSPSQGGYPHHQPLSYDQHVALPYLNKYTIKAAKKAARYHKKAQRYAAKASKYAAKAHVYRLQAAPPPYSTGYLSPEQVHPGHDCPNCKLY